MTREISEKQTVICAVHLDFKNAIHNLLILCRFYGALLAQMLVATAQINGIISGGKD